MTIENHDLEDEQAYYRRLEQMRERRAKWAGEDDPGDHDQGMLVKPYFWIYLVVCGGGIGWLVAWLL